MMMRMMMEMMMMMMRCTGAVEQCSRRHPMVELPSTGATDSIDADLQSS